MVGWIAKPALIAPPTFPLAIPCPPGVAVTTQCQMPAAKHRARLKVLLKKRGVELEVVTELLVSSTAFVLGTQKGLHGTHPALRAAHLPTSTMASRMSASFPSAAALTYLPQSGWSKGCSSAQCSPSVRASP